MYSKGQLTAAHRERLQRMLTKQEMTATTFKQAFRMPTRSRSRCATLNGTARQKSVPRIKASFTPLASRRAHTSQSKARPATGGTTRSKTASTASKSRQKDIASSKPPSRGHSRGKESLALHRLPTGDADAFCSSRSRASRNGKNRPSSCMNDAEVTSILNQQRLREQQARSKLPARSATGTLLYGCREEGALSPDATPRPMRLMKERDAAKGIGGVNWISIIDHNQRLAERDDLRNAKMEKAVRHEFRDRLQAQREEYNNSLKKEVEERELEKKRLSAVYEQWTKEDAEEEEKRHLRVQQLKMGYHRQLSALEQRRHYEDQKWKRRERRQVDAMRAHLSDERAKSELKKAKNKKKMQQVVAEYDQQRDRKHVLAAQEAAEEIRMQQEYAAQLERQEKQRHEAQAKIRERQTRSLENLLSATKSFKEQAEEDERRAEREQLEQHRKAEHASREKAERLQREQEDINAVILQQREEKEAQQQQERHEWRVYGDFINKDAELYAEEEHKHQKMLHRKLQQHDEYLREQIRHVELRKLAERAEMSDTERLYNQTLLSECETTLKELSQLKPIPADAEELTTERMSKLVDKRSPFKWRATNRPRPF